MSLESALFWLVVMLLGLTLSSLYSGLETGMYSLNRVRLHILEHQGHAAAAALHRLAGKPTVLLSTLLIGNNIANYLGTAGLAVLLEGAGLTDTEIVIANVLIVTPLLFVFGETLPKDLFARYSDRLVYRFAGVLSVSRFLFTCTGLLPVVALFSEMVSRLLHSRQQIQIFHPKRQVGVLVKEGVGLGLLSDDQSAMVERVLALHEHTVADEMIPWERVVKVKLDDAPARLWELADRSSNSRFPVLDAQGQVRGIVSVNDALLHPRSACPPIAQLLKPTETLPHDQPLLPALRRLQHSHVGLAVVLKHQRPVGIVTVKDLVEAITGELASW